MGKRPALLWGLVAAALLLLAGCRQQRSYRAQRFDVDIVVHEDGSALITETVSFNFQGGPFTHVFREIPLERTDGIEAVSVSEGDRTYTLGSGPHQYQVQSSGDDLRVTWQFPPTENTQRTFALSYRVAGLIRQEDGQDALRWAAIPPEHDYGMTRATVRVQLPRHVGPITGVRVLDGRAEIGRQGREVTFQAADVERDQALVIGIWFPHGQLTGVPPAWQAREMAQAGRSPIWIAAGALALALGVGLLAWALKRWGREPVHFAGGLLDAPPSDLAPGLAGALVHNGATMADILATLFDLARRGVVIADELETSSGRRPRRRFGLAQAAAPAGLTPFEAATLEATFSRAEGGRVSLEHAAAGIRAGAGRVQGLLNDALYERELMGKARDRIRRTFYIVGLALIVLALASIAVPIVWGALFGPWPLLLTAGLGLAGLAWLIAGAAVSRRTQAGEQAAAAWQAFRRALQQVAHSRRPPEDPSRLEPDLPYAVAFGLERPWSKQMAAAGAPIPSWFHALSQEAEARTEMAAFVALIVVLSASTSGRAGAGAAGGAAGGGASGAG